jgi:hypothetical protein
LAWRPDPPRQSLRLTDSLGSVVLLYPTYRTVEFPLDLLYRAGRHAEIRQVLEALQQIAGTTRQVRTKLPNIGVPEALAHWDTVARDHPDAGPHPSGEHTTTGRMFHRHYVEGPVRSCVTWR